MTQFAPKMSAQVSRYIADVFQWLEPYEKDQVLDELDKATEPIETMDDLPDGAKAAMRHVETLAARRRDNE